MPGLPSPVSVHHAVLCRALYLPFLHAGCQESRRKTTAQRVLLLTWRLVKGASAHLAALTIST